MNLIKYIFAVTFLLMVMGEPVSAADGKCSYYKSVKQGRSVFDVGSRPAGSCAVQIVTVTLKRGGKNIASFKTDVDYLAHSAQAVDLTGDGAPELVVISRTTGGVLTEALDVYWVEGATIHRSTVPEFEGKSGYRGGDRFRLEGRLIVRTIPVYLDGDRAGSPTGGSRTLKYKFREGVVEFYVQTEQPPGALDAPPAANAPQPLQETAAAAKPEAAVAAPLAVTGVTAGEAGIEIMATGAVEKFKVMKLENPERIAIDLPGATSPLIGKKIAVNRFGISKVRVGRNKGFLRLVLDTQLKRFPKYEVKSSGGGILVEFAK